MKHFALADLEWMVMPAFLLEQYRINHSKLFAKERNHITGIEHF